MHPMNADFLQGTIVVPTSTQRLSESEAHLGEAEVLAASQQAPSAGSSKEGEKKKGCMKKKRKKKRDRAERTAAAVGLEEEATGGEGEGDHEQVRHVR